MKKLVIAATVTTFLFGLTACNSDKEAVVETKAGDITKDDFYNELKDRYGEALLQELVTVKVLEDKYDVKEDEVDKKVKEAKDQLGDQFDMWLQQQGYGDEDNYRDLVKNSLLYEKAVYGDVKISDDELKERYDRMKTEIKASHILVEDEKTAKEVQKKLDEGADFSKLAKEYSTDEASAKEGGNLDYFSVGDMLPEFEDAAYSLKVDEISEPVKTDYGYHIIKVTDKREKKEDIGSFDDNKEMLKQELQNQKVDPAEAQEKIDKLMDDAKIDVKIKEFKDMFKTEEASKDDKSDDK